MKETYMTVETTNLHNCSCFSLQSATDIQNGAIVGKGDLLEGEKSVYEALTSYSDDAMYLVANPAWSYDNCHADAQNEKYFINPAGIAFRVYELKKDKKYKIGNLPSDTTFAKGDFVEFTDGKYSKASGDSKLKVVDVEELGFPYCIGSAGVQIASDTENKYGYALNTNNVKYTIEVQ